MSVVPSSLEEKLGRCLVTGAAGLLGRNLVRSLLDHGCEVCALIHHTPLPLDHPRLVQMTGDVREIESVVRASKDVQTVFHTAAWLGFLGGGSVTPEYRKPAQEINVGGTDHVIDACRQQGVRRLVYTSSVDVCFDGVENVEMDQTTPYATHPWSVYAETKIEAEKRVLQANGHHALFSCAIRSDGIYGPEPNLILDAIVKQIAAGQLRMRIGRADTRQDNSYVDNLVHGELLAALHLGPAGSANGKAYFICDGSPQNTFEFFRPLIEQLGARVPARSLPRPLLRGILSLWEHAHFRLGVAPPPATPHELDKISVSHYGNNRDAERDLGYKPAKTWEQAIQACLPYCRERLERLQQQRATRSH